MFESKSRGKGSGQEAGVLQVPPSQIRARRELEDGPDEPLSPDVRNSLGGAAVSSSQIEKTIQETHARSPPLPQQDDHPGAVRVRGPNYQESLGGSKDVNDGENDDFNDVEQGSGAFSNSTLPVAAVIESNKPEEEEKEEHIRQETREKVQGGLIKTKLVVVANEDTGATARR